MADLGRTDRGQIILIAAFALAVTFVALAVVVNSAIYTENLASRGETGGSEEALEFRQEVERGIGETVRYANVHNATDTGTLSNAVDEGTGNVSAITQRQQAVDGAHVDLAVAGTHFGTKITQNDLTPREFTDKDDNPDWSVVDEVNRSTGDSNATRAFELNVTTASLATSESDAFTVSAEEYGSPGTEWEMSLWRDNVSPDEVHVRVSNGHGDVADCARTLSPSQGYVTVHVTEGKIDGVPCDALRHSDDPGGASPANMRFASGVGPSYNVSFENGHNVAGNYSLVTTNASAHSASRTVNAHPSRNSPYATPAVYSLVLDYAYHSPQTSYETQIRVAPGEAR